VKVAKKFVIAAIALYVVKGIVVTAILVWLAFF
jgi:hypothetical protein